MSKLSTNTHARTCWLALAAAVAGIFVAAGNCVMGQTDLLDLVPPDKRFGPPTEPAQTAPAEPGEVKDLGAVTEPAARSSQPAPESAPLAASQAASAPQTAPTGLSIRTALLDRPAIPVTPPSYGTSAPASRSTTPDAVAVGRRAHLTHDPRSGWTQVELEATDDKPAEKRWMLPCPLLERMEQLLEKDPGIVFRISSDTTNYKELTFILPREATVEAPAPQPMPPVMIGRPTSQATEEPTSRHIEAPDEIMVRLLRQKPGKPVLVPVETPPAAKTASVAPSDKPVLPSGRGQVLADRLVRVVPGEQKWMTVRFVSDNTLQEPPMRLLFCRMLERAEKLAADDGRTTPVLRVSGEIFFYKGYNYLLLRKVLVERDLNQF